MEIGGGRGQDKWNFADNIKKYIMEHTINRKLRINESEDTPTYYQKEGVAAGSTLGPILWLIYLNEVLLKFERYRMAESVIEWKCLAYADDVFLAYIPKRGGVVLKAYIDQSWKVTKTLIEDLEEAKMTINMEKTEVLAPSITKGIAYFKKQFGKEPIKEMKILGVIHGKPSFEEHLRKKIRKVNKILDKIEDKIALMYKQKRQLYIMRKVVPKLIYGAQIWALYMTEKQKKNLNELHKRMMKMVIGIKPTYNLDYELLCVMCGQLPLDLKCKQLALNHKLKSGNVPMTEYDCAVMVDQHANVYPAKIKKIKHVDHGEEEVQDFGADGAVCIYIDGSVSELKATAGMLVFCKERKILEQTWNLHAGASSYDAELMAIKNALIWINQREQFGDARIYTDSKSVLTALENLNSKDPFIIEMKKLIYNIKEGNRILTLHKIKSHNGSIGNEMVDGLVKKALEGWIDPYNEVSITTARKMVRKIVEEQWRTRYNEKATFAFKSYVEDALDTRFNMMTVDQYTLKFFQGRWTTHNGLYVHNFLPKCICSDEPMSIEHILERCVVYEQKANALKSKYGFNATNLKRAKKLPQIAGQMYRMIHSEWLLMKELILGQQVPEQMEEEGEEENMDVAAQQGEEEEQMETDTE